LASEIAIYRQRRHYAVMGTNLTEDRAIGTRDVVIVGGGAAGLSAAVTLARSRRSVLVIDAGQPRNAPATGVHNFLSREGTDPVALLNEGRAEVRGYGGELVDGEAIAARGSAGHFAVDLRDCRTAIARRLLVTTGLTDELPDIPGMRERWGRDVVHCPYCHGWEVRDQPIAILSTSSMTVHSAQLFRQLSPHVTVLTHTGPLLTDQQVAELAARDIAIVDGKVLALEVDDDALAGVRLDVGTVVACRALAVRPRFVAHSPVLTSLGLRPVAGMDDDSAFATDPTGATEIPGVWAAGNVVDVFLGMMASAGAGVIAAGAINADLIADEVARALAADGAHSAVGT
jgi:thioredoxin reductase